jgi:hypothetical protein
MRGGEQNRLALGEEDSRRIDIDHAHAPAELLGRQGCRLDHLHEDVGEARVVAAPDVASIVLVELREALREVGADHLLAVGKYAESEPAEKVGE